MTSLAIQIPVGERIGNYVIVHANGSKEPSDDPAEPVGSSSGNGVVYRAIYRDQQHRAIKFLHRSRGSDPLAGINRDFYRERIFLTLLTHSNIVRFHDTGLHDIAGERREYIVTEFIHGKDSFLEELEDPQVTGAMCYRLIGEVIQALIYMHSIGVGHGNVKTDTIHCRIIGTERQAVLLDLASAQVFDSSKGALASVKALSQLTLPAYTADGVASTANAGVVLYTPDPSITHPEMLRYLEEHRFAADLAYVFPYQDLYAVGHLLEALLHPARSVRAKLRDHLLDSGLNALEMIVKRLKSAPGESPYLTMAQLYEDWDKLRHSYLAPAEVPELSIAAEFKYSLATPVGRVVITPRLSKLVEHSLFQRLRDMPQLELLNLRYTGATHTRQQHAIVMFRNTRYYLAHLLNGPVFRLMTNRADLQATLVLALLRGIGHYQLSHFFEDYASEQRAQGRNGIYRGMWKAIPFDIPTDRDLFPCTFDWHDSGMLRGDYHDIVRQCCAESCARLGLPQPDTLAEVTKNAFDAPTRDVVMQIFDAAYRPERAKKSSHFVLAAILKSEIDADKISYLKEDAVETGVHFGEGIDLDGLLGALRAPSPCDIDVADGPIIGVTDTGIPAVESVLSSRNEMYERVYWHHSTRAIAAMIKFAITRLLASGTFDMPDFVRETFYMSSDAEALRALWARYQVIRAPSGVNPISNLLFGQRGIYKPLRELQWSGDQDWTVEQTAAAEDSITRLIQRSLPEAEAKAGDLVIDLPIAERGMWQAKESLYVYEGNSYEAGKPIGQWETSSAGKVRDLHLHRAGRCRVFISPLLQSRTSAERLRDIVAEGLGDAFRQNGS